MAEAAVTSERVSIAGYTSSAENFFIFLEHLATYNFAQPYTVGKDVLDFGCGTGYGTHHLSGSVRSIIGVDISTDAIDGARRHYLTDEFRARLDYRVIDPVERAPLPFDDDSFDTVLSFQVIEHVQDVDRYLDEVRRVLRPKGVFVCATPDRRTRLFRGQRPFNRYHLREWAPREFEQLLTRTFPDTKMFGMSGSTPAISSELKRCRMTRTLAYPFTFPGAPEPWRQLGLRGLKSLSERQSARRRSRGPAPSASSSAAASSTTSAADADVPQTRFGLSLSDVTIGPDVWPSINIITVST